MGGHRASGESNDRAERARERAESASVGGTGCAPAHGMPSLAMPNARAARAKTTLPGIAPPPRPPPSQPQPRPQPQPWAFARDRDVDVAAPRGAPPVAEAPALGSARAALWPTLALAPVAVVVALALHRLRRGRVATALAGLGAAFGLGLVRWQMSRLFRESVAYDVEGRVGPIEIRRYAPHLTVETTIMHRSFEESLRDGAARLFRYASSERVAVALPIETTCDGSGITIGLPFARSVDLVPDPADERLTVREIPERHVAVLRYAGAHDDARAHARQKELLRRLEKARLRTRGETWFAGYDGRSTLPLLRRVEACVEIEPPSAR